MTVAESGVEDIEQVKTYAHAGADAVLVGEALVKHAQPRQTVTEFTEAGHTIRSSAR